MINTKMYVDILSQQAKEDRRPYEMALSDFCDYLLDFQRGGIRGRPGRLPGMAAAAPSGKT